MNMTQDSRLIIISNPDSGLEMIIPTSELQDVIDFFCSTFDLAPVEAPVEAPLEAPLAIVTRKQKGTNK